MESSQIPLIILELLAVLSCVYGAYSIQSYSNNVLSLTYNGLWFLLGFCSNICGLISIAFTLIEDPEEYDKTHTFLQYHYLLAWFTVIVGYPTLVSSFWMIYYPGWFAHINATLALAPVGAWLAHQNRMIIRATQVVSAIVIISHGYICVLANNQYGLAGAAIMAWNVVALSMPTRYNIVGISSREAFLAGLSAASYVLAVAVEQMANKPVPVKNLMPWW